MVGGVKMTLLRLGDPGPVTHRQIAKHMSNIWRQSLDGRSNTPKEFGLLIGLAKDWPEGQQVEVFKAVMKNWSGFMAGAKLEIASNGEGGEERYFKYPCISFMRRFWPIGIELWEMEHQAKPTK